MTLFLFTIISFLDNRIISNKNTKCNIFLQIFSKISDFVQKLEKLEFLEIVKKKKVLQKQLRYDRIQKKRLI